jgi:hypothetical protein
MIYTYLTGRGRTGSDSTGPLIHAVDTDDSYPNFTVAVCGAEPGPRSNGWSEYRAATPTCPKCIKRLEEVTGDYDPYYTLESET